MAPDVEAPAVMPEERCFLAVKDTLKACAISLRGACVEASVELHRCLVAIGVPARLVRRENEGVGHWTVRTPRGEFDPTITSWNYAWARKLGPRGSLYKVRRDSPHLGWPEDPDVDEHLAYQIADEEMSTA